MTVTNETRRRIMNMAWFLYRDGDRTFSQALKGAWKLIRGIEKEAARLLNRARGARHIMFSKSLIRSPIDRVTSTQRYAGVASQRASIVTSRLGG